jgi:hypothetical protein
MGAIARRYNIQETSDGDRSGCFFKVPIGEEVAYHEHLMKDEAIGYVEYVINGVPELSDKIDEAISDLKDLSADIFSCSTKVGVDALIQERIDGLERLRL